MKYTCPCCGYKTLDEKPPGTYNICPICFWEDDPVQFDDPSYEGGANHPSLRQAQKNFLDFGATEKRVIKHVRKPAPEDMRDPEWKPFQTGLLTVEETKRFLKERGRMLKTEDGGRVSKILFELDPIDLRRFGVPEDEYDGEAEMLVERIMARETLSAQMVREVFEKMFSQDMIDKYSSSEAFENVVKALKPISNEIMKKPPT